MDKDGLIGLDSYGGLITDSLGACWESCDNGIHMIYDWHFQSCVKMLIMLLSDRITIIFNWVWNVCRRADSICICEEMAFYHPSFVGQNIVQALCCHYNTGPLYSSQHDHELAECQNTIIYFFYEQSSPLVQKVPLTIHILVIVKHASYDGYSLNKHQILLWICPWSI